ncbi:MAG: ATP-binding protein [Thermofilum sp.]
MLFIDREDELRVLEEAYSSGRSELVLIYGRRRIGKTFLLSLFLKRKGGVYLCVNHEERDLALRDLAEQLSAQAVLPYPPKLESFRSLYEVLASLNVRLIVIDEFQRLLKAGGLTELQHAWDAKLSRSNVLLVLSGSAVGVAERVASSPSSPIFGRAARVVKLGELSYSAVRAFLPSYSEEDKVRSYAVFGGVPGYLSRLSPNRALLENVEELVLKPGAPLREEPLILLKLELRNPSRYAEILRAVAEGATQFGEIADRAGLKVVELPKYLKVLEEDLNLIERRYPLLEEGRRGRARYHLRDHFTRFWFKAVYPSRVLLELGLHDRVSQQLPQLLDQLAAQAFEEVAHQHFALLARRGLVSFTRIGRWWMRDVEIDLVALDERGSTAYFGEAKWSKTPLDKRELYKLEKKAEEFAWRKGERREVYVLYSRAGFTFQPEENVHLYSLEDLSRDFEAEKPSVAELG